MQHILVVKSWTPGSYVGETNYTFLTNKPPFGGGCSVSPEIGEVSLLSFFSLS